LSTTWDRSFLYMSSAAADRFPNNYTNDYNGTINGRRLSTTTHATEYMCVCVRLESESVNECVCVCMCACWDNRQIGIYTVGVRVHRLASFLLLWAFLVYDNRPSVSSPFAQFHRVLVLRARKDALPIRRRYTQRELKKTVYKCVRNVEIK